MIILLFIICLTYQQPCTAPVNMIGTTAIVGTANPASTASTDITTAELGGVTLNQGVTYFSISFWFLPSLAVSTINQYLLRVTSNAGDTGPSTSDGVRFGVIFSYDQFNSLKRGFQVAYAEVNGNNLILSDITQFLLSYSNNEWMYIFCGQNYETGKMILYVWQITQTFYQMQEYTASKVNFNNALGSSVMINFMYWGSQTTFYGSIKKANWMPGYYEKLDQNIMKIPYFMEAKTNTQIYLIRCDRFLQTTDVNIVDGSTITFPANMNQPTNDYSITNTNKEVIIEAAAVWPTADKSYTFGLNFKLTALPTAGLDQWIFAKTTSGGTVNFGILLQRSTGNNINFVVKVSTYQFTICSYALSPNVYYYIQISMALSNFFDTTSGYSCPIVFHYHLIADDSVFTNRGYYYSTVSFTNAQITTLLGAFTTSTKVTLGSSLNTYYNQINIRNLRFQTGFSVFSGDATTPVGCLDTCAVGIVAIDPTKNFCLICQLPSRLDSTYLCLPDTCSTNYFKITDMVSYNYCAYCNVGQSYYVSSSETCIQAACGNGFLETVGAEQCDDGNTTPFDGCDATCKFEAGYLCAVPPLLQSTCTKLCGNGQQDTNSVGYPAYSEQCDDGNTANNDGCSSQCTIETNLYSCLPYFPSVCTKLCGNSQLNIAAGQTEQCDDGNVTNGDGCSSLCQIEAGWECPNPVAFQISQCNKICGNGIINAPEVCDDGNQISGDGCTNCLIDAGYYCSGAICTKYCGNSVVDAGQGEQCDDGNTIAFDGCTNCIKDVGWTCNAASPTVCQLCGNGKKEGTEVCDDGNVTAGDGCSALCNIEPGWTCNGASPDLCNNCGDGKKQQVEQCDDGNATAGDGCTNCLIDQYWACVGGSPSTADTCTKQCPNGVVQANEQCDTGSSSSAGCVNCIVQSGFVCTGQPSVCSTDVCGNGMSNQASEQCDDGNVLDGDGCSSTCQIESGWTCKGTSYKTKSSCTAICGDGLKVSSEICDDGNLIDGDGCSKTCTNELGYTCSGGNATTADTCIQTCGNNIINSNEQCDDGNIRNGDGCTSQCLIESGFGCANILIQGVTRNECFNCIDNCGVCQDTKSCSLCFQGYFQLDNKCKSDCGFGYFPNYSTQTCDQCSDKCDLCFDSNICYNCAAKTVLQGYKCLAECPNAYFVVQDELKGNWCKQCPSNCLTCTSETQCTSCADYYSINGVCQACNLGTLCLGCDFTLNTCVKCQLGYQPNKQECVLIPDQCGDSLKSNTEICDDGNLLDGDGCSSKCEIETGFNCSLLKNQGPSVCYDTKGWDFTLQSFILDPTIIQINFRDPIRYNENLMDYNVVLQININSFSSQNYTYKFKNDSGSNQSLQIQFTFLSNVVSQTLTVQVVQLDQLYNEYGVGINPNKTSQSISLYDIEYYTDSQLNQFELFNKITLTLQVLNWILVIGGGFLGQDFRIWKVIEIMQLFAALFYINLSSYPENNNLMFDTLRYSNLYLLPNVMAENTDQYLDSLRRFTYAGQTHKILNNSGGIFIVSLAISVGAYFLVKLIYLRYVMFVFEVFLDKLEFSYFFKLYELFLMDLLICCFLNIQYNSMSSDWDGTNTVISLIIMLLIATVQIAQLLVLIFKEHFGNKQETDTMFGTLYDGLNDDHKLKRIFISQADFIKKFFIAFACIYVTDPFQQILFIAVPRAVITIVYLPLMKTWFLRAKEVVTEMLVYGVISQVYMLSLGNFVGDLDTKVFYGWLLEYMAIGAMSFHFMLNTYLVWKLLQNLEHTMPEQVDPSAGLNKKVDLFKLKPGKGKLALPQILKEDMEKDVHDKEKDDKLKRKQEQIQNLKNKDREKWNVWDMDREAAPEERKFVSINHNDLKPQDVPKGQDDIIRFDELDSLNNDNDQQNHPDFFADNQFYPQQAQEQMPQFSEDNSHNDSKVKDDNPFEF